MQNKINRRLLILCASTMLASVGRGERPNIIMFLIDDQNPSSIAAFGGNTYTPNIDRMAKEGRKFTDFYVTQAVCSASRAGLLTGCYNNRIGIVGALGPKSNTGLNPDEITLAEICKEQGYATACFGKWHLGHHREFLPLPVSYTHLTLPTICSV